MLRSLKCQRTKLQKKISEEIARAETILKGELPEAGFREEVHSEAESILSVLDSFKARFDNLSEKITEAIGNQEDEVLDAEGEFVIEVVADVTRITAKLTSFLSRLDKHSSSQESSIASGPLGLNAIQQKIDKLVELHELQVSSPDLNSTALSEGSTPRQSHSVRLPTIEFDKFSGNVLKFQEFWDSFDAAINSNSSLRPVEKLNYLRAYLTGEAKQILSGLTTSDANYEVAVELVKKRFGDPQASIDSHYSCVTNLPSVLNCTAKIRSLFDQIETHLRCLSALGEDTEHRHFISLIMSKLPREVVTRLEESRGGAEPWTVQLLRQKLQILLGAREAAERQRLDPDKSLSSSHTSVVPTPSKWPTRSGHPLRSYDSVKPHRPSTVEGLVAGERQSMQSTARCILCSGSHYSDQCPKFRTVDDRRRRLRGRCFVCLKSDHQASQCQSLKPCFHCKQIKKHNRCLCPAKFPKTAEAAAVSVDDSEDPASVPESSSRAATRGATDVSVLASGDRVLLQTAQVEVQNPNNAVSLTTRVLLDCASNRSYISSKLAQQLEIKGQNSECFSVVTFGCAKAKTVQTSTAQIKVRMKNGSTKLLDVNVVPQITGNIHRSPVQIPESSFLWKDLPLADSFPVESENNPVDFLIGNDYYLDIVTSERMEIANGLYLLGSRLGWILTGRLEGVKAKDPDVTMFVDSRANRSVREMSVFPSIDQSLPVKPSFDDFWKLESIGIADNPELNDDDKAITRFNSSVKFEEGRYQVSWPWKDSSPDLPDNFQLCKGRFISLLNKFQADKELFQKYANIVMDQEEKQIIEKVTNQSEEGPLHHYIPHHAVLTPSKATTKVRIVYDASSKTRKGVKSLNECLLRGPVILQDLAGLLLRFRTFSVGLVADIEKAFLQIALQPLDRDVTRFFWLKDPTVPSIANGNMQIYRFCRVPFGMISSPFLLGATVRYHLLQSGSQTAKKIADNLYVDNMITGSESAAEAVSFYQEAKSLFAGASMNLREWASNSNAVISQLPAADKVKEVSVKVLGLTWNTDSDSLQVSIHSPDEFLPASTKRQMLQSLASVFDPLGFFAPLTLRAKLFIHQLWLKDLEWDDPIDQQCQSDWRAIASQLLKISDFSFPRFVGVNGVIRSSVRLLCFCDASAKAYATVLYLHVSSEEKNYVNLLFAKSRLAPAKKTTIPRMELLAVLIGVRCLNFVSSQLRLPVSEKVLWTDSQCVLHWLNTKKPLTVFVENRLKEIRKSSDISFKYVKTHDNPADLATRGQCTFEQLNDSMWWRGPTWLSAEPQRWPCWPYDSSISSPLSEEKVYCQANEVGLVVSRHTPTSPPYGIDIGRFSSWIRLLRVTAWMTRFICKARKMTVCSDALEAKDISAAKLLWDRYIQAITFPEVFESIRCGKKCNIKEQLNVNLDEKGLLRCYGRFLNAELPDDVKFPKLLPKTSGYTDLVIRLFHVKLLHSGVNHTLSQIRLEYWIPQGRSAVRSQLSKCVTCRRNNGGPYKVPLMPPWPRSRITISSPFAYTGLDYLGPLHVKNKSHDTLKVWVCLFTCMAVRAIHLELVTAMSTSQFLLCFRRFIARRGKPIQVLSDNATQFKLSKDVLNSLWGDVISSPELTSYVSAEGISWKFIIERAPWMGGFYERLVGSVKVALKKCVGKLSLTIEQLSTIVTEIEAVINSRPLCYLDDAPQSDPVLTPSHFLSLNPKVGIPVLDMEDHKDPEFNPHPDSVQTLLHSWKKGQKLLQNFWSCWSNSYLTTLRERSNFQHKQDRTISPFSPAVGDVVLIKDDNLPRGSWKLGRIYSLITSNDGLVRAAQLKISSGNLLNRPTKLLYPLECNAGPSSNAPPTNLGIKTGNCSGEDSKASDAVSSESKDRASKPEQVGKYNNSRTGLPRRAAAVQAEKELKDIAKFGQL